MSRVAIVGVEGSGKTVLMAAIADLYGNPSHDAVYLMPESQSAFAFMKHIPHKMRSEHQWPAATTIESFKHLKWSARVGQRIITEIEMLDYPGELYRLAFGERSEGEIAAHRDRIHEFLEHLVTADVLVVLFNLKDALEIGHNARNTETVWLTRGIFEYAQKLPNIKHHLLLFTQADRYPAELGSEDGPRAAMRQHLPMMQMLFPDLECAAVSVATDNSETPSHDFSASFGIAKFMKNLVLLTPEGSAASATIDAIASKLASENRFSYLLEEVEILHQKISSLDSALCEIIDAGRIKQIKHQLYGLLQTKCIANCNAIYAEIQNATDNGISLTAINEYASQLEDIDSRKPEGWESPDPPALLQHRQASSVLRQLGSDTQSHIERHSGAELRLIDSWLPLLEKYANSPYRHILDNYAGLYIEKSDTGNQGSLSNASINQNATDKDRSPRSKKRLLNIFLLVVAIGTFAFLVILARQAEKNWQINERARKERLAADNQARKEQLAADEKARQEQLAAEEKARQEQLAAEEKARVEKELAAKKAREELEQRAAANDPVAQWELGYLLFTTTNSTKRVSNGYEKRTVFENTSFEKEYTVPVYREEPAVSEENILAARNLWRRAAERGHLDAQLKMGEETSGDEQIRWYTLASKQGSHVAASNLGSIFRGENYAKSAEWYVEALRLGGGVAAHFNAAQMYDSASQSRDWRIGEDQKNDYRGNAINHYTQAARQGHLKSQKWLNEKGLTW